MYLLWKSFISLAIFLNYQNCGFSASNNEVVIVNESERFEPTARKYVVVFAIDGTLCAKADNELKWNYAKRYQPESPIITWKPDSEYYVFLPYLQVLFDYLLEKGARVVFFSDEVKDIDVAMRPLRG